jgi:hypothetical protein
MNLFLRGEIYVVKCVIQLVDPLFSIIVFAQLRLGEAIAAFLREHFHLLLDEVDEFLPKLFLITRWQDTPLWAKRRVNRWEKSANGWHQDRKLTFAEYDESGRSS